MNSSTFAYIFCRSNIPTASQKEVDWLATSVDHFTKSGFYLACEEAKKIYRELHPGLCKMFSQGEACQCFLCQIDNLLKETLESKDKTVASLDVPCNQVSAWPKPPPTLDKRPPKPEPPPVEKRWEGGGGF